MADAAQRNRNLRQRKVDSGKRQLSIWLDESLIDRIDQLKDGQSRSDIINDIVTSYIDPPKKAPAKRAKKAMGTCSLCGRPRPDSELKELLRGANRYRGAQCKDWVECNKARGIIK